MATRANEVRVTVSGQVNLEDRSATETALAAPAVSPTKLLALLDKAEPGRRR